MSDTQAVNDNQPEHWVVLVLYQGEQRVVLDNDPNLGILAANRHRANFEEERRTWHPSSRFVYCDDSATLLLLARKLWQVDDDAGLAETVAEMLAEGCTRYDPNEVFGDNRQ